MEEIKITTGMRKNESDDSLSSLGWTFVDEVSKSSDSDCSNNGEVEEEEVKSTDGNSTKEEINETILLGNESSVSLQAEESDGISVITESEAEHVIDETFTRICKLNEELSDENESSKKKLSDAVKCIEKGNLPLQVGVWNSSILKWTTACTVAFIIGLGIGRVLNTPNNKFSLVDGADFCSIKTEIDLVIDQIKELTEARDILDDIKATIPEVQCTGRTVSKKAATESATERGSKNFMEERASIFGTDAVLKQLQVTLTLLSSVTAEIKSDQTFENDYTGKMHSVITDLTTYKRIISELIQHLDEVQQPLEFRFLDNVEEKVWMASRSLLNDFSQNIHKTIYKTYERFEKIRQKLRKKICLLHNTLPNQPENFEFLRDTSLLENCNKNKSQKKKRGTTKQLPIHKETFQNSQNDLAKNESVINLQVNGIEEKRNSEERKFENRGNTENVSENRTFLESQEKEPKPILKNTQSCIVDTTFVHNTCPVTEMVPWLLPDPICADKKLREDSNFSSSNFERKGDFGSSEFAKSSESNFRSRRNSRDFVLINEVNQTPGNSNFNFTSGINFNTADSKVMKNNYNKEIRGKVEKRETWKQSNYEKKDFKRVENQFKQKQHPYKQKGVRKNQDNGNPEIWNIEASTERNFKQKNSNKNGKRRGSKEETSSVWKKFDDLSGDWQFKRSRAREKQRDSDQTDDWFFERANARKSARDTKEKRNNGKFETDENDDEYIEKEIHDYHWLDQKGMKNRKNFANNGFGRKVVKMTHRKNIMQKRRR